MATTTQSERLSARQVIDKYGHCLELIGMDPHFHDVTIGLYVKDDVASVWTFSPLEGVRERLEQIRDQLVLKGSMTAVEGTRDQVHFACGEFHGVPMRFLLRAAVEKEPIEVEDSSPLTIRDIKSRMDMLATPEEIDGRWAYRVTATGDFKRPEVRIRAMVGGFMRYGDMERLEPDLGSFKCGQRHDALLRVLMPYARNVSGSEDSLEADNMRGQLTTQTLGYSQ